MLHSYKVTRNTLSPLQSSLLSLSVVLFFCLGIFYSPILWCCLPVDTPLSSSTKSMLSSLFLPSIIVNLNNCTQSFSSPDLSICTSSDTCLVRGVFKNLICLIWNDGTPNPPWWIWWCLKMWESSCLLQYTL